VFFEIIERKSKMKNTYEIKDNTNTINAFRGNNILEAIDEYLAYFNDRKVETIKSVTLFHYGNLK
tara:strand:- start:3413 stop:3607 length:195 start_codon:yes stop_codon:yes gene_type:complete